MTLNWTIHPISSLGIVKEDWEALCELKKQLPVQDFEFWSLLMQFFGSGNEMVCICHDNDEPVAVTIVDGLGRGRWEAATPAQAPVGAWICKDSLSTEKLLASLAQALPRFVLSIGVPRLDPAIVARPRTTGNLSTMDYISTGRICCEDEFDRYWAKRGKNLRQNLNRQRNRLERDLVRTRMRAVVDADLIGMCVDAYGRLESSGWKAESGTALHPDNAQGRFYRALFEHYCKSNEAVVYEYYYDSQLVATDLCLQRDSAVVILKTTHDESQKKTSPALLMRQESLREMLDARGISRIEFYGKQMDWHTKWTDDFRTMYHINYDRWSAVSRLRKVLRRLKASTRQTS